MATQLREVEGLRPKDCTPGQRYLMPSGWVVTYVGETNGKHYIQDEHGERHLLGNDTRLRLLPGSALHCKDDLGSQSGIKIVAVKQISISNIRPGRFGFRSEVTLKKIQRLKSSIERYGVQEALWVRETERGIFEILDGHQRYEALKELSNKDSRFSIVPVAVLEGPDTELLKLVAVRNTLGQKFGPLAQAPLIQILRRNFKLDQISILLGISEGYASDLSRIYQDEALWDALRSGNIKIGHARHLLRLEGEQRLEALQIIVDHELSIEETEAIVKLWKMKKESKELLEKKRELEEILTREEWECKVEIRDKGGPSLYITLGFLLGAEDPLQNLISEMEKFMSIYKKRAINLTTLHKLNQRR
jgi:ParB family chromosome partitioning protein